MALGHGKYDEICTRLREELGITEESGGVVLIVVGGNRGSGFSAQCDLATTKVLPDILEQVAKQMRVDVLGIN